MKHSLRPLCAAAALLLLGGCSLPDFAAYPAQQSSRSELAELSVTLALPLDAGDAITEAARLLGEKSAELSGGAVSLRVQPAEDALERFLSGKAQMAFLPLSDIAPLVKGLSFPEYPFVFRRSELCQLFLNSEGNCFSDNPALEQKLGGRVALVCRTGGAGLLSRGELASDEYLTDCKLGALAGLPGSEVFADGMQAQSVAEYPQEQIFDALIRGEITQGELTYGAAVPPLPGVDYFYALDQRASTWWLLIRTEGEGALPEDAALLLSNAASYMVAPLEDAAAKARSDTIETMTAMGITVVEQSEFEYYFFSALEYYWNQYAADGLSDDMFTSIYSVIS